MPKFQLQWGHGDEAVEEAIREERRELTDLLQWGHGDEAVEESVLTREHAGHVKASMGPRR